VHGKYKKKDAVQILLKKIFDNILLESCLSIANCKYGGMSVTDS